MANGQAQGQAQAQAGQQQPQQGSFLAGLFRMAMMWYAFKQFFGGKSKSTTEPALVLEPSLPRGTPLDVHFFVTDDGGLAKTWPEAASKLDPTLSFENVPAATGEPRVVEYVYRPSQHAQNNGSVSVHAVFTKHGSPYDPTDASFDAWSTWGFTKSLTTHMEEIGGRKGVNLLGADGEAKEKHQKPLKVLNYLKPNVTVSFVDDYNAMNAAQIPPHMSMNILNRLNKTHFSPHVYWNEFWLLRCVSGLDEDVGWLRWQGSQRSPTLDAHSHDVLVARSLRDYLIPLNETVVDQKIYFVVEPLSSWKAQLMSSMENSFKLQVGTGTEP